MHCKQKRINICHTDIKKNYGDLAQPNVSLYTYVSVWKNQPMVVYVLFNDKSSSSAKKMIKIKSH